MNQLTMPDNSKPSLKISNWAYQMIHLPVKLSLERILPGQAVSERMENTACTMYPVLSLLNNLQTEESDV